MTRRTCVVGSIVSLCLCLYIWAWLSDVARKRNAVITAMEALKTHTTQLGQERENDEVAAYGAFANRLEGVDVSDCPAGFQEAWLRFLFAVRRFEAYLKTEPSGFFAGFVLGLANFMVGEMDGGVRRMAKEHDDNAALLLTAFENLLVVAARYEPKIVHPSMQTK